MFFIGLLQQFFFNICFSSSSINAKKKFWLVPTFFICVWFFNLWRPCIFTNYLSVCILVKIYWTKKLFWAMSLGTQTSIPASKSHLICLCFFKNFICNTRATFVNKENNTVVEISTWLLGIGQSYELVKGHRHKCIQFNWGFGDAVNYTS